MKKLKFLALTAELFTLDKNGQQRIMHLKIGLDFIATTVAKLSLV